MRTAGSIAGCAHANSSSSRLSGIASGSGSASAGREVVVQWRRGAHRRGGEQVADAVAGHGHEPPLRVFGDAVRRPGAQRPLEGVGERILGEGDVSCRGREQRHEPAVRLPRGTLAAAALESSAVT